MPKEFGGLKIINIGIMNIALILKWISNYTKVRKVEKLLVTNFFVLELHLDTKGHDFWSTCSVGGGSMARRG
jgi:hypothetical protein